MKMINAKKWLRLHIHLNGRTYSTKPNASTVPAAAASLTKRRRLPLLTISATGFLTTLVYATYLSEQDATLKASMDKVPYLSNLTDPIKEALSKAKSFIANPFEIIAPNRTTSKEPVQSPPVVSEEQPPSIVHTDVVVEDIQPAASEDNSGTDVATADAISVEIDVPVSDAEASIGSKENILESLIPADDAVVSPTDDISQDQNVKEGEVTLSNDSELALPRGQGKDLPPVPSESVPRGIESSILKQAIADSARELIALRRDLEMTLLRDLHLLDENTLRLRIKHVVAELFDRLAWEDLRLSQSLKGVQAELTEKFTDLMAKQRAELEFELRKLVFAHEQDSLSQRNAAIVELEERSRKQLSDTIQSQAEGFNKTLQNALAEQASKIQGELQDQFNNTIALIRKDQVEELLSLQPKVQQVASELNEISNVLSQNTTAVVQAGTIHATSSAVLGLELSLASSLPVEKHVSSLKANCKGDELVEAVLTALPESVLARGALSLSELQVRFNVMRDEVRKDALAPEAAPTIVGQFIGAVLAAVSIAPSGYVRGPGTEEALARAAYQLDRGRLEEALKELNAIQGYGQVLMRDWKKLAYDRIAVDQSVKVLKANALLRHLMNKA